MIGDPAFVGIDRQQLNGAFARVPVGGVTQADGLIEEWNHPVWPLSAANFRRAL